MSRTTRTSPPGSGSPTKQQRRDQAREEAREARVRQERARRRRRVVVASLLGLVGLAFVAALVLALQHSRHDAALAADVVHPDPSPALVDVAVPGAADAGTGGVPVSAAGVGVPGDGVTVDLYLDAMCPYCGILEQVNGEDLADLVADDGVTVVYHPLSILDDASSSAYSTRAANALGVVADGDPERFPALVTALFAEGTQPAERSAGLDDDELAALAHGVGVPDAVTDGFTARTEAGRTFAGWVAAATNLAPRDERGRVTTPVVLIDGTAWTGDFRIPGALRAAIEAAG
ncbi:DsbA family protein [Cellulomonas composti]|nr:thioredoxin domain-containing protein [Cellulomonas composti]